MREINAVEYAKRILKDNGYEDVPSSEIYEKNQLEELLGFSKEDRAGWFAAIVVGFINGAEWERINRKIIKILY